MRLRDSYDGAGEPFEGDHSIIWRSLPENAVVTRATVTLEPRMPPGQSTYVETLHLTGPDAAYGATVMVFGQSTPPAVEVDFHARRRAIAFAGIRGADSLAVDIGGGVYLAVGQDGAIPAADGKSFNVSKGALPGVVATRLRLIGGTIPEKDGASIDVATQPSNLTLRFDSLPAFWSRPGDLAVALATPDVTNALKRALEKASVVNGFYEIPIVLHSDTVGRIALTIDVEYLASADLMPAGLREVVLSYDYASVPKAPLEAPQAAAPGDQQIGSTPVLRAALPAGARIVSPGTALQVRGGFANSRVAEGAVGPIAEPPTFECSRSQTLAQPVVPGTSVNLTGVDLFVVPKEGATQLALDVRADLDGKPSPTSLLAKAIPFPVAADAADKGTWISVPTTGGAQLRAGNKYWIAVQALDDRRSDIGLAPAPDAAQTADPGRLLQRSGDSGFSWRLAGPSMVMLLRLRTVPDHFSMPIAFLASAGSARQTASLAAYDPLGKVDAVIDRPEIAAALQSCVDLAVPHVCRPAEQLRNADFAQWSVAGDMFGVVAPVALASQPSRVGAVNFFDTFFDEPIGTVSVVGALSDASAGAGNAGLGTITALTFVSSVVACCSASKVTVADPATLAPARLDVEPKLTSDIVALAADLQGRFLYALSSEQLTEIEWPGARSSDVRAGVKGARALIVSGDGRRGFIAGSAHDAAVIVAFDFVTGISRQLANFNAAALALSGAGRTLLAVDRDLKRIATFDADNGAPGWSAALPDSAAPLAVAAAADGVGFYVLGMQAGAGPLTLSLHAFDGRGSIRKSVPLPGNLGTPASCALAVKPQGDRIYIAGGPLTMAPEGDRLAVRADSWVVAVALGQRHPSEWTVTAGIAEPVSVDGGERAIAAKLREGAMSQVIAIAPDCTHELTVSAIVTTGTVPALRGSPVLSGDASAEIFWLRADASLLRRDAIALPESTRFVTQRLRVSPPAGCAQAEVRMSVTGGAVMLRSVSLRSVASLVQDGAWLSDGGAASTPGSIGTMGGTTFRNIGSATRTFSQRAAWSDARACLVTFRGVARRMRAGASPTIEVYFEKQDGTDAGSPEAITIDAGSMALRLARLTVPDATRTIRLQVVMPAGTQLDAEQFELVPLRSVDASCGFVAQSPGELHVLNARIIYDIAPPPAPTPPPNGLANPTPPGRNPGERSSDCGCGNRQASGMGQRAMQAILPSPSVQTRFKVQTRKGPVALTEVFGIGPARAQRLVAAGIGTADELAAATPDQVLAALAGSAGGDSGLASALVQRAKEMTGAGQ
jgi:hypothetical protein